MMAQTEEQLREALAAAQWALRQAAEDLAEFEAGTRSLRSVSTASAINAAMWKIEAVSKK
jgi:hypothetical protein